MNEVKRYFTGKPCKAGHIAERFISNRYCVECSKEQLARWRKDNAGIESAKAVDRVRKWRTANPERTAEYAREHWAQNKPRLQEQKRLYYKANKLAISASARKQREKNRQAIDERVALWRKENPESVRAAQRNYRARLTQAEGSHTASDVIAMLRSQDGKCFYCCVDFGSEYHVDHKVPLFRGGSNWPGNLCLACPSCNISKGAKTVEEFREYRAAA